MFETKYTIEQENDKWWACVTKGLWGISLSKKYICYGGYTSYSWKRMVRLWCPCRNERDAVHLLGKFLERRGIPSDPLMALWKSSKWNGVYKV